jgi:hypothetical protein
VLIGASLGLEDCAESQQNGSQHSLRDLDQNLLAHGLIVAIEQCRFRATMLAV